jgi:hypothetical protein
MEAMLRDPPAQIMQHVPEVEPRLRIGRLELDRPLEACAGVI